LNIRAILTGVLAFCVVTLLLMLIAILFGMQAFTAPQLLTLSSLWLLAGYAASRQSREAGILHGLLATLIGMLLIMLLMWLAAGFVESALVGHLMLKPSLQYLLLAGFWGATGGMIGDIVRLVKLRRAMRR
jgi:hypothetical protein